MDWEEVLAKVISCLCGLVISVGVPLLVKYIASKVNNDYAKSLIEQAGEIVKKCVVLVDQTYVDALKAEGKFTKECQEIAFNKCKEDVLSLLSNEAQIAIINSCGDLETWLNTYIESAVRDEK